MVFIVDGQRIATENFLVGQLYKIIYKNDNIVYAMCEGIGHDFVMFISDNPRIITLNIETAQTIDSIMPAEAGSMYDYNDLINKPTINNIALIGNLTSSELGLQTTLNTAQMAAVNSGIDSTQVEQIATNTTAIGNKQDVIDSSHMLSADLVDDSSSTQKFATAAQLSQIATNTTAIAGKQNTIDSTHKLSADLVDDSSSTQKFATAAQLSQISTNETNISLVKHAANTSLYFQEIQPDNPTVGDYWISTLGNKVYSRTANLFDDTNIINIPNLGERYGVQLPAGYYSILNTTENPVFYATANWSARQQACAANSSATINLNLTEGDVGGIFMPLNSASQGGCMVVAGTTIPTEYVPYYDWI